MVRVKRLNEPLFVKLQKQLTTTGELIRARQEEKQALLNEFDQECKRFFFGRISEKALESSVRKTNRELQRLDNEIRTNMQQAENISRREIDLISRQKPEKFKATISGISTVKKKIKKKSRKKKVKKKSAKKSVKKRGKKKKK